MSQIPRSAASSTSARVVASGKTAPVGLPGLFAKMTFVLAVTSDSISAGDGSYPADASSR